MTAVMKLRLKFIKAGEMRWLSHLEISRAWRRIVARAGLPVLYSEGFSPHPKIALSSALAVGIGSAAEYADIMLAEPVPGDQALERINLYAPPGLKANAARAMDLNTPTLGSSIKFVDYRLAALREIAAADIAKLDSSENIPGELSVISVDYTPNETAVTFRLPVETKFSAVILSMEQSLGLQSDLRTIDRAAQWVQIDGGLVDPIDVGPASEGKNG